MTQAYKEIIDEIIQSSGESKSAVLGYFEHLLTLKNGSGEKVIDPDDCIQRIIEKSVQYYDMVALVMCFKHGGNPNLYINAHGLGPAHILVYGYNKIKDSFLYTLFYNICMLLGSSILKQAFDINGGKNKIITQTVDVELIKKINNEELIEEKIIMENVEEWLHNQGIKFHNSNHGTYHKIPSKILEHLAKKGDLMTQLISVFLNLPELYKPSPELYPHFLISRNYHWNLWFDQVDKDNLYPTNSYLIGAMKSCFSQGAISILECMPSYFDFVFWIATYKKVIKSGNDYLINECENIFKASVEHGFIFDNYSLDEIGLINMNFRKTLLNLYKKPYWSKVCSSPNGKIPSSLSKISLHLGIPSNSSFEETCSKLLSISSADFESLKKAIKNRSKEEIKTSKKSITEFINPSTKDIMCNNISDYEKDPMMYSDYSFAYYSDSKDRTWCYLSNSFENILETKINKETNEKFPQEFLFAIEQKVKIAKYFNISLLEPVNLEKIIVDLKKNDEINNVESDFIVSSIIQIANLNGISEDDMLNKITINEYGDKFSNINVNIENVIPFDEDQRNLALISLKDNVSPYLLLVSLCRFLYGELKKDLTKTIKFFKS